MNRGIVIWSKLLSVRRWHLLTWAMFLFWALLIVPPNIPQRVTYQTFPAREFEKQTAASAGVPYYSVMLIGLPFTFQEHSIAGNSTKVQSVFYPGRFVLNLAIIIVVQCALVYSTQHLGRYSVRMMLAAVPVVALLIVAGQLLARRYGFMGVYYLVLAIYLSPVVVAVVIGFWRLRRGRRSQAGTQ